MRAAEAAWVGLDRPMRQALDLAWRSVRAGSLGIGAVVTGPDGVVRVQAFHWGLIPSWAKDRKIGSKMINARAETLADKPAFKGLFAKKRCLIPMDGYYEWQAGAADGPRNAKGQPLKQPTFIHRLDGEPMAVAGLWSAWKDTDDRGRWLQSAKQGSRRKIHSWFGEE